jgi:hypothetical protein
VNRNIHDIRALLGPLNPEPDPTAPEVRTPAIVPRRAVLIGAATAVAVAAAAGVATVVGSPPRVTLLATPTPLEITHVNGGSDLGALVERWAVAAEQSPAATLPATEYLRLSAWYLDTAVTRGSVESQLRPHESESWRHPDGSWTVTTTDGGTETFPPGTRGHWTDRPPVNPAALDAWLNSIHPMSGGDKALLTLSAITDLLRERVLLPAERAAVLRVLATIPGLRHAGAAVDRAGRTGEALVLDTDGSGLPARHTLVVDPTTGTILANEEMLTEDAGRLNVSIPAVVKYETYLVAEFE